MDYGELPFGHRGVLLYQGDAAVCGEALSPTAGKQAAQTIALPG